MCLLKNIEILKKSGNLIKEEWIKPDILTFQIPNKILDALGLSKVNFKNTSDYSHSHLDRSSYSKKNSMSPNQKKKY